MEDRELLELAAKAAGFGLHWLEEEQEFFIFFPAEMRDDDGPWNPLKDDGDALRLAITLGMDLRLSGDVAYAYVKGRSACEELLGRDDKFAATRRAIVRAAAEIGKAVSG